MEVTTSCHSKVALIEHIDAQYSPSPSRPYYGSPLMQQPAPVPLPFDPQAFNFRADASEPQTFNRAPEVYEVVKNEEGEAKLPKKKFVPSLSFGTLKN